MLRKNMSAFTMLFALLMAFTCRLGHAQSVSTVYSAGGVLYQGSYAQAYANASTSNGRSTGTLSIGMNSCHIWGFVNHIDWISPNEVHLFAPVHGQAAMLEVDLFITGSQYTIGFRETDNATHQTLCESGRNPDGSMLALPLLGSIRVQPATQAAAVK